MSSIIISFYDLIALVCPGLVVLFAADTAFGFGWSTAIETSNWKLVLLGIASYVFGHILSHFSSWIVEHGLVAEVLGKPEEVLFTGKSKKLRAINSLFPAYFRPLPSKTLRRIHEKATEFGCDDSGESLFHHARALVRREEQLHSKLEALLAQYGFARNMSLSLAISAVLISAETSPWFSSPVEWSIALSMSSVVMLYRYLKFYRQYAFLIFTAYPEIGLGR